MPRTRKLRTQFRLPVSVGRKMAALTSNISSDGFCLEVMRPIPAGTEIDGYVLHKDRELSFRGVTTWMDAASPQASYWSRVGVRFLSLSPGLRALLSIEQKRSLLPR